MGAAPGSSRIEVRCAVPPTEARARPREPRVQAWCRPAVGAWPEVEHYLALETSMAMGLFLKLDT